MSNQVFLIVMALFCGGLLAWGFASLTGERWQILAALPAAKNGEGLWRGVNLTYYGFFTATAMTVASALVVVLMGAMGVGLGGILAVMLPLISLCVPAARVVARVVENKPFTFTVAGAFFVGLLTAPWITAAASWALGNRGGLPVLGTCAAISIAYAFGEGLGRLACISFGCCYGRPLSQSPAWVRRLLGGKGFVFTGATKKVSYEGHLEGEPLVPIQAVTAVLYVLSGLAGLWLFLEGMFGWAVMETIAVTQLWRAASELLRADYRGESGFTAYQKMSLFAVAYTAILLWLMPGSAPLLPVATRGLDLLWNPGVLLTLQALWLAILLYTGRSKVTTSTISFHVLQDRI